MAYVQSARECEGLIGSKSDGEVGVAMVRVPQPRQMTKPKEKKRRKTEEKKNLFIVMRCEW